MDLDIDWTFRVGDIIEVGAIVLGGDGFALRIDKKVDSLKSTEAANAVSIAELKHAIASLSETTITLARQDERMKYFEKALADAMRFTESVRTSLRKDISENIADIRVLQHPGG